MRQFYLLFFGPLIFTLTQLSLILRLYYCLLFLIYCLQFYVHLGPKSPLDEKQIMEDRLSFGTSNMPQTWPGRPCL